MKTANQMTRITLDFLLRVRPVYSISFFVMNEATCPKNEKIVSP